MLCSACVATTVLAADEEWGRRCSQVAFEVRVEPGSYLCGPPREPVEQGKYGPTIEWYTNRTSAVFLSGLLVRVKPSKLAESAAES